jgi:hypothetical protein
MKKEKGKGKKENGSEVGGEREKNISFSSPLLPFSC